MPDGCSSTDSLGRVLANPVRVRCIMKTDLRTSQAAAFCSTPICESFFAGSQSDKAQVRKEQGVRIWTHNSWPGAQPENVVIATRVLSWFSGRWIGCTLSSWSELEVWKLISSEYNSRSSCWQKQSLSSLRGFRQAFIWSRSQPRLNEPFV